MFQNSGDKPISITEINALLKKYIEQDLFEFPINLVGEVSNLKKHSSGHWYFSLKDETSTILAVMFKGNIIRQGNKINEIKNGDEVEVKGKITVYEARGQYQILVETMDLKGLGDLFEKFELLKKELSERGIFDPVIKKKIPKIPKKIGIITSDTGAAFEDIKRTISERYRLADVLIYPALTQGKEASKSLANQLKQANLDNIVDVIILGRGGGSIEDLWPFNEIETVMAIYESAIPVVTGIGHEIDMTLSDYAADYSAATPTQAAVYSTPDSMDLLQEILMHHDNLVKSIARNINKKKKELSHAYRMIESKNPKARLNNAKSKVDDLTKLLNTSIKMQIERKNRDLSNYDSQLHVNMRNYVKARRNNFNRTIEKLEILNPLTIMSKGYSIVKLEDKIITKGSDLINNDVVDILFADGSTKAKIIK